VRRRVRATSRAHAPRGPASRTPRPNGSTAPSSVSSTSRPKRASRRATSSDTTSCTVRAARPKRSPKSCGRSRTRGV
jgi:hypothetical protein